MFFIQFNQINKSYSEEKNLIQDLNLTLSEGNVLGIIGRNGEGKTTLLKILVGQVQPDSGQVILSKDGLKIAYHTQFLPIIEDEVITIEDYILLSFPELYEVHKKVCDLATANKEEEINRLILLQSKFEELSGYEILASMDRALVQLGLADFNLNDQVSILSGGQKTRLQLAKVIVRNPDILLLDEPTNHLDKEAILWLESYVKQRKGITVIVSHNRSFLNNVTNQILELERGGHKLYSGNYDDYCKQKQEIVERNLAEIKQNAKKTAKLQEAVNTKRSQALQQHFQRPNKKDFGRHSRTIMRNKAGKKARQAKMYQKRVDERIERNKFLAPKFYKDMNFNIQSISMAGDFVLRIRDLDVSIENKLLIKNICLEVQKGDRIAITGENGSGKTTLLRTIIQALENESISQTVNLGKDIYPGYYSQEHEGIGIHLTVLEDFRQAIPILEADAANYLHNMLFNYGQLRQKAGDLSEGEKSKLALAKLLAQEHNFLILDEPTNHLDIASIEVLEKALESYKGSILCVSHDQYFLQKIAIQKYYRIINQKLVKEQFYV